MNTKTASKNDHLYFENRDQEINYNKFLSDIKHEVSQDEDFVDNELVDRLEVMDELGLMNGKIYFLLDYAKLEYKFMSKGVKKILGYSSEEFLEEGFKITFRLQPTTSGFSRNLAQWFEMTDKLNPVSGFDRYYTCGYVLKHRSDKPIIFFIQIDRFMGKNLKPKAILGTMTDVSHLVKPNLYWGKFMNQGTPLACFSSKQSGKHFDNFFTNREKEILHLLQENTTDEIALKMGIAIETVNRHKKNMLSKLGAKNTTALIQLCKMSDLI